MRATIPKRMLSLFLSLCLVTGFLPILPSTALAVTPDGTMSATIYTGKDGDTGEFTGETSTFAVDQSGLILDLRDFSSTVSQEETVLSLAFYPVDGSSEYGTVFWYEEGTNGTAHDKLYAGGQYNGVFQVDGFAPNGGYQAPEPGTYKVLAYVGNGTDNETLFLSTQEFTITDGAGPAAPTIVTDTLPGANTGEEYRQTLEATAAAGGVLTWSVTSGNLPAGLNLSPDGTISGTPTQAGTFTFTATVAEAGGRTASKSFFIAVTQKIESEGLKLPEGDYSPGDTITVSWYMNEEIPVGAEAVLTLRYQDADGASKSVEYSMNRRNNYFYAFMKLPDDCAAVQKLSAAATVGGQTVTEENANPGIAVKGKLALSWDSLATGATLAIKDVDGKTVVSRYLGSGSTGAEVFVPAGSYTLSVTGFVTNLGERPLMQDVSVVVQAGKTTEQKLSFQNLQATTYRPTVEAAGGSYSTGKYDLRWYKDQEGEQLLYTGRSYTALSTDAVYVQAVPIGDLTATHKPTEVDEAAENMTLTMPAKPADTVTVTVQCDDVVGGSDVPLNGAGPVVLSQPGSDGTKTTQKWAYTHDNSTVTFEGVTAGSTITFTPSVNYACGPVSTTIDAVEGGGSQEIELVARQQQGVIDCDVTLERSSYNPVQLSISSLSNLTVKHGDTVIPYHRADGSTLVLDSLGGLQGGYHLTISGQYGSGSFPIAIFETEAILSSDGKLAASADINMVERGTLYITSTNRDRVAADLLLYRNDELYYTKTEYSRSTLTSGADSYTSSWYNHLPEGEYIACVVNHDYLRGVDPESYQKTSEINFEDGTYHATEKFTIEDKGAQQSFNVDVPGSVPAYADVNFEASGVTMSAEFPTTFTHTTTVSLNSNEQLDETKGVTLTLYHNQNAPFTDPLSMAINGMPYNMAQQIGNSALELKLTGEELEAYGGFPLRISYVMKRFYYDKLDGASFLEYTNDSGELRTAKVGEFYQETSDVVLSAPSMVNEKTFTVYGYVPQRNQDVTIYLDGAAVATVQSGWVPPSSGQDYRRSVLNGYFEAQITLPDDVEEFDEFSVSAACNGRASKAAEVMFTEGTGLLTKVTFCSQRYGDFVVWENGRSVSEGLRKISYFTTNEVNWEVEFANPDKVDNVIVHVPCSDGTELKLPAARKDGETVFTTEGIVIDTVAPSGVYVTYDSDLVPQASAKDAVTDDEFDIGMAALNTSGIIERKTGNQGAFDFTLQNPDGGTIPVSVESTTEDWSESAEAVAAVEAELQAFEALKKESAYAGLPSYVLYYDEGYLDIYEDDDPGVGFWGSDRVCKYQTAKGNLLYQREIYTMGERCVITWDVEKTTKTVHRITLGDGSGQPDEFADAETAAMQAYQRTLQVQQLWSVFYQQLYAAYDGIADGAMSTQAESFASTRASKPKWNPKINLKDFCERAQAVADDSETWAEGQEITADEIRQFKDFLDDNPGLVDLYKMYQSQGGENPYQVVGDIQSTFYEKNVGLLEKIVSLATGKPQEAGKAVLDGIKDGVKDYALDTLKGKVFYRQSQSMSCDLYNASRLAERTESGVGGMLPNGINWSRFPSNLYDNGAGMSAGSSTCSGSQSQTLPNSPSGMHDPSGYVYEAVPSNRVEGATVELYTYNLTDEIEEWVDNELYGIEPNPQTTGADGRYEWFVPEGYWRVVASKDGYVSVDTGDNQAYGLNATKELEKNDGQTVTTDKYWMPVLPIQLDVNIPLVSYEAPIVQKVEATAEGVYVTFSKYLQTDLKADNFRVGDAVPTKVEPVNAEASSASADAPVYASVFKLSYPEGVEPEVGDQISLYVGNAVTSYAGVPMEHTYAQDIEVAEQLAKTATPQLAEDSPASGSTVAKNTVVNLTAETGATMWYTTDGSEPSTSNGKQYRADSGIVVDRTMTVKAIAVKAGMGESDVLTLAYKVEEEGPVGPVNPTPTPGGSDGGGAAAYGVAVADCEHGKISAEPAKAAKGDTVTVTVTPEEGFEVRAVNVTDAGGKAVEVSRNADGTFSFVMPAGNVTVSAVLGCDGGTLCPSAGLTDVDQSQWYHDAVDWAVSTGVMTGFGNGLFGPDVDLTRAQMAQILWNVEGRPAVDYPIAFGDVSGEDWFHGAVAWAASEGIFEGYGAGSGLFGPEDALTREQAAAVLMRWAAFRGEDTSARADLSAYPDAGDVSEWAVECVSWAVAQGVIAGVGLPDGTLELDPLGTASRAQTATLMMRLVS